MAEKKKILYIVEAMGGGVFTYIVDLYDDQTMKIEFNCEDVIRRALEKYGA